MMSATDQVREHLRLFDEPSASMLKEAYVRSQLARQFLGEIGGAERIGEMSAAVRQWQENEKLREIVGGYAVRSAREWLDSPSRQAMHEYLSSPYMQRAQDLASRAELLALPLLLADYRPTTAMLAERIGLLDRYDLLRDDQALDAFTRTFALSEALIGAVGVNASLIEAVRDYASSAMPVLGNLAAQRAFLDAAGLRLPRWPRIRLLTAAEKRKRFKTRLQRNVEPPHVKKAKSLVHRYELTMREIIDAAMADAYGEDWADQRLPLCDCKTLIGKRDKRGGEALDHADYAHYRLIMCHPDHFALIFHQAFPDPQTIAQLIDDAGRLRAASHHARDFSSDDLRDLRIVWRTLEVGLLALTDDVTFDDWA